MAFIWLPHPVQAIQTKEAVIGMLNKQTLGYKIQLVGHIDLCTLEKLTLPYIIHKVGHCDLI